MKVLTVDDIELVHIQIIDASGGAYGMRDRKRIEAVVATQTQHAFGRELYKNVHEKAAALARGVICDHPFLDSNKRTGIIIALLMLEMNNVKTAVADKELEDFAVQIAVERLEVADIAKWLQERSDC